MVQVAPDTSVARNKSVFLADMAGSRLPIVVSHGEGRADFSVSSSSSSSSRPAGATTPAERLKQLSDAGQIPLRYIDNYGAVTEKYPANPNGSPDGVAGVSSKDGRVLALMPHPERTIMADAAGSWVSDGLRAKLGPNTYAPWFRLFLNARKWVG